MRKLLWVLVFSCLSAFGAEVYYLPNGDLVGTGARRPSKRERAMAAEALARDTPDHPNRLALDRVNPRLSGIAGVLPEAVDNSTLPFFPPIRSQGSLASCSQFATIYYAVTHMNAMAKGHNAKLSDRYRFSPKWTYNMLNKGSKTVGGWHYDAYNITRKHGLVTWEEFPYNTNYRQWLMNQDLWVKALLRRPGQYGVVRDLDTDSGMTTLKQLLANGYVLNFNTFIGSWVWSYPSNDPSTAKDDVLMGKPCVERVSGTQGGHTMTVVGYNDALWLDLNTNNRVDVGERGALRIANSWGQTWNEAGFVWISYNALRKRNPMYLSEGLFWFDEASWITMPSGTTRPRLVAKFWIKHLKRNQINMALGVSSPEVSTPEKYWYPYTVLNAAGGPYAFDGTTVEIPGAFCLDCTELLAGRSGMTRIYLVSRDNTAGTPLTLLDFSISDPATGAEVGADNTPQTVDGSSILSFIDYELPP